MTVLHSFLAVSTVAALVSLGGCKILDIQAHRGGRALYPENTLPAFANALSLGVTTLELDVGVTRDGVIVVSHDRRLNADVARTSAGNYVASPGAPLFQLTLAEIRTYDVGQIRPGSDYAARYAEQRAVPGTPMPTLAEVLMLVRESGNSHVRLNIETKIDPTAPDESPDPQQFASQVLEVLQAGHFRERVMIQSFDWRTLQFVQQLAPAIPTVYLTQQREPGATVFLDRPSPWTAGFDPVSYGRSVPRAIKAAGGAIWSPMFRDIDATLIREAHRLGLKVVVWTVNDPSDIAAMINMGVDGIISDRPDLLRDVAAGKGFRLPAPTPLSVPGAQESTSPGRHR